jgi:hypothetical protein
MSAGRTRHRNYRLSFCRRNCAARWVGDWNRSRWSRRFGRNQPRASNPPSSHCSSPHSNRAMRSSPSYRDSESSRNHRARRPNSRMRCYSIHFVASRHKTRCFRRMPNDWSRPRFRFQNFRRRCSHNQTDLRCYIRRHSFRLRSLLRNSRLIAVTARLRTRRHPTAPSTDIPTTDRPRFRARILHCSGRCSNERRLRLTGRN